MNVRDLLIALVRYAIKGESIDKSAIEKSLNDKKLATLFKVAKGHDVAHLVCYALEKNGINFENSDTWQSFLKEKEQAVLRYQMIQADINEICACFDSRDIDYIKLKGAIVRNYYPEPWMRTSCDVDILVRENDLDKAVNALVSECSYTTDYKKSYHDISLYSPFGMHVELHYNIKENEPKYDELLTRVWEFSKKSKGNGHEQAIEFLILHLTAHMAYHFIGGGCGLRSVLDLWLLNQKAELDKSKLESLLEKAQLEKFYSVITELGKYWFENACEVSRVISETEKYILLGGAYGTIKQGAITKQVEKGGKFKYFISRIFIPYESLAILYPVVKKHKILVPFCQIARWFSAIFRSEKVKREISAVSTTTKEQNENMKWLLDELGV